MSQVSPNAPFMSYASAGFAFAAAILWLLSAIIPRLPKALGGPVVDVGGMPYATGGHFKKLNDALKRQSTLNACAAVCAAISAALQGVILLTS
jgi:hypothetical protein